MGKCLYRKFFPIIFHSNFVGVAKADIQDHFHGTRQNIQSPFPLCSLRSMVNLSVKR